MRNLTCRWKQDIFSPKIRETLIFKKGQGGPLPASCACIYMMITVNNSTLGFYLHVLQKWIIITISQSSPLKVHFFFFPFVLVIVQSLYLLHPFGINISFTCLTVLFQYAFLELMMPSGKWGKVVRLQCKS